MIKVLGHYFHRRTVLQVVCEAVLIGLVSAVSLWLQCDPNAVASEVMAEGVSSQDPAPSDRPIIGTVSRGRSLRSAPAGRGNRPAWGDDTAAMLAPRLAGKVEPRHHAGQEHRSHSGSMAQP